MFSYAVWAGRYFRVRILKPLCLTCCQPLITFICILWLRSLTNTVYRNVLRSPIIKTSMLELLFFTILTVAWIVWFMICALTKENIIWHERSIFLMISTCNMCLLYLCGTPTLIFSTMHLKWMRHCLWYSGLILEWPAYLFVYSCLEIFIVIFPHKLLALFFMLFLIYI